jgi:hypothetical protein
MWRIPCQWEIAATPGKHKKTGDLLFVKVIERSVSAERSIKWTKTGQLTLCGKLLLHTADKDLHPPTPSCLRIFRRASSVSLASSSIAFSSSTISAMGR